MKSRKGITMGVVAGMFIDKCTKQDLYDPHWEENLAASERVIAAYASSEGACHRHASGKNKEGIVEFSCVAYSEEGVVRVKKLGLTPELRDGKCSACGKDKQYKAGILVKDERITELEMELKGRADKVFKAPKCHGGAQLHNDPNDQLVFNNCKKHPSGPVSVEKFCRVYQGGLPCMSFAEVVLGVGERA
jgi:hypothetical protein